MVDERHLRRLLRDKRQSRGLTQASLATLLGKPQSFVSKYESGERLLSFAETISICLALDFDPRSLLKQYLSHHDS
jgi:transcriptional regulator with XRE-family HTH domain